MPEFEPADPRRHAEKSRNALRGIESDRGLSGLAATPGKTTLTAAMAPTLGAVVQLQRLTAEAMRDVPALEAANQRGDVSQALAVMASVRRYVTYAPALLAEIPRGKAPDLEANVRELLPRAVAAFEAGPRLSRTAMEGARRRNYAQWDAEVSAWREARGFGQTAEPAADAGRKNAVDGGHESHKTKYEFKRGNVTGAINLTIEEGKTGIALGDDAIKAFKNTSSMKVNGFVAKLETALLSGKLSTEVFDGVKIEFEANALKTSTDGNSVSTDPLTIGVKLTGDVAHWWGIRGDFQIKLEGGLQVAFGGTLLAKHLAKVTAAEIEQRMLATEIESVSAAVAKHATAVRELKGQLATAASRGLSHQEIRVLERQLLEHTGQIRAGAGQLKQLSGLIAEAQVRAARALGGVKNFVAKKVGRVMEARAAKFVATKLIKIVPILNAVSLLVDIVDLIAIVHAIIKGKYGSGGEEGAESTEAGDVGDGNAHQSHGGAQSAPASEGTGDTAAASADAKRLSKASDDVAAVVRAAPPAVIGQWFEAHGDDLEMNEVGKAWTSEHSGARVGDDKLVEVKSTARKIGPEQWDLHLVFVIKPQGRTISKLEHDFWVLRGEKPRVGAKVGDLAFEPFGMISTIKPKR